MVITEKKSWECEKVKKIGIINGILCYMIYSFQCFDGNVGGSFPFYIYSISCERLANGSLCGCVLHTVCIRCFFLHESHMANIPHSNMVKARYPHMCMCVCERARASDQIKIPLHIIINFEIPIFYRAVGMSTNLK